MMAVDDKDFDRVWHAVFGNGTPGMDELIRANTRRLDEYHRDTLASRTEMKAAVAELGAELKKTREAVDNLAQERRDDNARREGSKSTLNWIKWGLGALAILITLGGAIGLTTLLDTLGTVSQQLNRIPPLPE